MTIIRGSSYTERERSCNLLIDQTTNLIFLNHVSYIDLFPCFFFFWSQVAGIKVCAAETKCDIRCFLSFLFYRA